MRFLGWRCSTSLGSLSSGWSVSEDTPHTHTSSAPRAHFLGVRYLRNSHSSSPSLLKGPLRNPLPKPRIPFLGRRGLTRSPILSRDHSLEILLNSLPGSQVPFNSPLGLKMSPGEPPRPEVPPENLSHDPHSCFGVSGARTRPAPPPHLPAPLSS